MTAVVTAAAVSSLYWYTRGCWLRHFAYRVMFSLNSTANTRQVVLTRLPLLVRTLRSERVRLSPSDVLASQMGQQAPSQTLSASSLLLQTPGPSCLRRAPPRGPLQPCPPPSLSAPLTDTPPPGSLCWAVPLSSLPPSFSLLLGSVLCWLASGFRVHCSWALVAAPLLRFHPVS